MNEQSLLVPAPRMAPTGGSRAATAPTRVVTRARAGDRRPSLPRSPGRSNPGPRYESLAVTGPWTDSLRARYLSDTFDGIRVSHPHPDLGFVQDLPGLRSVAVVAPVADDTAVTGVGTLERLSLHDGCGLRLELSSLPRLRFLDLGDRDGLESVAGCEGLESLSVRGLRRESISWVGASPLLQAVHLRGTGQDLDVAGLAECPGLSWLDLADVRVETFEPLLACTELAWVSLRNVTVTSLRTLRELPRLRRLTLEGLRLDGGRS